MSIFSYLKGYNPYYVTFTRIISQQIGHALYKLSTLCQITFSKLLKKLTYIILQQIRLKALQYHFYSQETIPLQ